MAPANPLELILQFVLQAAMILFLARFILQACRVDFYNPISQGIVRITDYALKPLRVVLPGYANLDFASFLAAWACLIIDIYVRAAMSDAMIGNFVFVLAATLLSQIGILSWVVSIFQGAIFIMIIASWIAPSSYHPALVLVQQVAEPILAPARKLLPPMGGLDLSPLIVILALILIDRSLLPFLYQLVV